MPGPDTTATRADPANAAPAPAPLPAVRLPDPPAAGAAATPRRWWPWVMAGVVAVAAGIVLYLQPWVTQPLAVMVETAAPGPVTRVLAVNGRVAALTSVNVRPLVAGTLTDIAVAEGDVVAEGATLAQLDSAAPEAVVRQAKAGLDAALVAKEDARTALARTDALGAVATRTARDAAASALQAAVQEEARLTALMDQASLQLQNHTIRAPMAGTVLVLTPSPGQIVDTTTTVMTIADMAHLVVETDVDEAYATQVQVGQTAALQLSGETALLGGHVSHVSQQVDTASGGLAVKLAFDGPVSAPIGLTVTANIVIDSRDAALTVPRAALDITPDDAAVFVLVDGVVRRQVVTVIEWPAARLIVTDGLAVGDVVITDAAGLRDGQAAVAVVP